MSVLTNITKKFHFYNGRKSSFFAPDEILSEGFWFTLSFLLFVVLGPFSAIPAFLAVMSLGNGEDVDEPEAL